MKTLLAIFLLTMTALPIDRPFNHWAFWTVKCDVDACYEQPKILYDTRTVNEAIKRFQFDHPNLEIRCITRDYYFQGCTPWY